MYMCRCVAYPFCYIIIGKFNLWFEWVTQLGYGVNGVYMLGILLNGIVGTKQEGKGGAEWASWSKDNNILAPLLGFLLGSFMIFPFGNPVSIFYAFVHYKVDHAR